MTATQMLYEATANAAATLGIPTPFPPNVPTQVIPTQDPLAPVQPTQQPQIPAGSYPPNATVITATPFGQPGICSEHLIQPGETLSRIALNYGVSTNEIAVANNIVNPDLIEAGQTLLIPCYIPPTATPVVVPVVQGAVTVVPGQTGVVSQPQIYTVQVGDNIYQISLRFGVDMSALVAANGLNATTMNMIYVGQQLVIPGATTAIVVTATPIGTPPAPVVNPTLTPFIIIVTSAP
jgi:LysM repeat protein